MSSCRDCAAASPGGPSANRFAAYDSLCANEACRAPGNPQISVSLADLSLFVRVIDLTFGGPQPSVSLERYYNQDGIAGSAFGNRWSFNLSDNVSTDADSSIVLRRGTGRTDRFASTPGSGGWFSVTATSDSLTRNGDGTYVVSSTAGTVRIFSADGRLTTIKDGAVTRASLDYDGAGRLTTVRSHGRTMRIGWNGDGRVNSVTDSAGRTVNYTYSGDGNLTQQTNADGSTVSYQYNQAGLLSSIAWKGGTAAITYATDDVYTSVSSVTAPDGAKRTYDIPSAPREVRVTDGASNATLYASGPTGLLQAITDASGNRTTFAYDAAGRRTRITNAAGENTRFEYDAAGNLTAVVDGAGNRWTADYAGARLAHITDAKNNAWTFGYDDSGNLNAITAPNGGQLTAQWNTAGGITNYTANGQSSTFEYDADGLVTKSTDAANVSSAWQYDGAARVSTRTDGAGTQIKADYDSSLAPSALSAGDQRIAVDKSAVVRDALGRVTSYTDSFGNQTGYSWNAAGRLAQIALPGNKNITYEYDRNGRLTRVSDWSGNFALYKYDAAGYPVSVNVSGGPVTVYQYDAARNLKAVVSTGPDGAPVSGYRYTLDANANRTGISALEPSSSPIRLTAAAFGYDAANRPVSRDSGTSLRYDARGNVTSVQGGPSLTFAYDAFGRLQSVTGDATASYTYDGAGLRVSRTSGGNTRRFVYDVSGARPRLVMETDSNNTPIAYYVSGVALLWKVSADGKAYFYHFDGDGNVVAVSSPASGVVNKYRYDPLGRLVSSDEGVDNPFRARGAAGVMDDGNGLLYSDGRYFYPDLRLSLTGSVDVSPPAPNLTPAFGPAGECLLRGVTECALGAGRSDR